MADKQYPPPTNPSYNPPPGAYNPPQGAYNPPPPGYYQPPAPAQQTNVVVVQQSGVRQGTTVVSHQTSRQPVVVQSKPQSQAGGFFSSLGKAFDSAATDLSKAANSAASSIINPTEMLRNGKKILIESKACGRYLRMMENGLLECSTDKGLASQFVVVKPLANSAVIKLSNVARPAFFLAIQNGYTVGYGNGGADCEFIPSVLGDWSVTFESSQTSGSHIGVLPTGELTAPAQTNKQTDASHFKLTLIGV